MITAQDIELMANSLRHTPRKSFMAALANKLRVKTTAELLYLYLTRGGRMMTLGDHHLYPQSTDLQVVKLILTRNTDLHRQLSDVSVFWPNKYIAALWHCSPHWVEMARYVFQVDTTDTGIRPELPEELAWTQMTKTAHLQAIYKATGNARIQSWEQVGYELGLTPHFFRPYAQEYGIAKEVCGVLPYPKVSAMHEILAKPDRLLAASEHQVIKDEFLRCKSVQVFAKRYNLTYDRARYLARRCNFMQQNQDHRKFHYEVILRDRDVSGMTSREIWDRIVEPVTEQSYHSRRMTQVKEALRSLGWVQVLEGKHCFQWFRSTQ